ncbi:unnamed protein product [Trichobilharzia regenti]|nr:unnamed protein product [Trichobilharzia regenti]
MCIPFQHFQSELNCSSEIPNVIKSWASLTNNAIATLKSENDANLSSEQFPALHTLELRGNRLVTLSGIDDMINLKTLYCAENMLRRLEGISGLKSLVRLHLRDNRITTLSGFTESLTSLEYINLRVTGSNEDSWKIPIGAYTKSN